MAISKRITVVSLYQLSQEMLSLNMINPKWDIDWKSLYFDIATGTAELIIYKEFEGSLNEEEIIECPICQATGYLDKKQKTVCNLCDGDLSVTAIEHKAYLGRINSKEM